MEFANDRITGLRFDRAKRQMAFTEFFDEDGVAQPPRRLRNSLDTTISFTGTLVETTSARQKLPCGSRQITIRNVLNTDIFSSEVSTRRSISAGIHFIFDLESPSTWAVSLDEPATITKAGPEELGLVFGRAMSITSRISQGVIRACEMDPSRTRPAWSFDLPAGRTGVTLDLDVRAWSNVSDTVVLCRPDQMREAAIAVAAVPDRRFVPLMVLESPPMSLSDFGDIFREFRSQVENTLGDRGAFGYAEFARKTDKEQLDFFQGWVGRRAQQQRMQPYRSWAKRNTMLRKALLDFGIKKAVCLFEPAAEDLILTNFEDSILEKSFQGIDFSNIEGLLDGIDRVTPQSCRELCNPTSLDAERLDKLFQECRQILGGPFASDPIEIDDGDSAAVILGLYEARKEGRSLRIRPGKGATARRSTRLSGEASANHVVAVEVQNHAQSLVASLFAAEIGTTLITLPAPELAETQRIVKDLQEAVVEQSQRSQTGTFLPPAEIVLDSLTTDPENARADPKNRLFDFVPEFTAALRKYVFGDRRQELLRRLEREVSRQIPPEFIKAVGTSALTIFGSGLPYSFVKTRTIDWSEKRVGHVISDADLIVISELHNSGAIDPIVSFNLIVDPGFFGIPRRKSLRKC
jgi:hypothetical protein